MTITLCIFFDKLKLNLSNGLRNKKSSKSAKARLLVIAQQEVRDKGSIFSLRRRRIQIVLAAAVIFIGLLITTGVDLLSIFGSSNQLVLERDYEWVYEGETTPGNAPVSRIRVKANQAVDAWRILDSDAYAPGGQCDDTGSAFEEGSGDQLNPYAPSSLSGILKADPDKEWVELYIRGSDSDDSVYCFKAVDYPERNDNKYVKDDDDDTLRTYLEFGPLDFKSRPVVESFTQTDEGVLEVETDKDVWKLRARRSDTLWLDSNGQTAACSTPNGWHAYGGQGRKADNNAGYSQPTPLPDRTIDGANDADFLDIALEEGDVGKYFCILLLDYYGHYSYVQTPEIQPLASSALLVSFAQNGNSISASANQDVAWRAIKTRSWKLCDAGLFEAQTADDTGEIISSLAIAQSLSLTIEAPYSYHTSVSGGYATGDYSYCFESIYNGKKIYNKSPAIFDPEPTLAVIQYVNTLRALYADGIARNFQVAGPFGIADLTDEDCEDKQFGSSYSPLNPAVITRFLRSRSLRTITRNTIVSWLKLTMLEAGKVMEICRSA